jgi:hypothetical protein
MLGYSTMIRTQMVVTSSDFDELGEKNF